MTGSATIARAHYNDPTTSFLAAERAVKSGLIGRQSATVFCGVLRSPGCTSAEHGADEADGLDRFAYARRLPELVTKGLARRGPKRVCRIAGTLAVTWWPMPKKPKQRRLFQTTEDTEAFTAKTRRTQRTATR